MSAEVHRLQQPARIICVYVCVLSVVLHYKIRVRVSIPQTCKFVVYLMAL